MSSRHIQNVAFIDKHYNYLYKDSMIILLYLWMNLGGIDNNHLC